MIDRLKRALALGFCLGAVCFPLRLSAWGEREVSMQVRGPECGMEVVYRRTYDWGKQNETYAVHAEPMELGGVPCWQSISLYPDRVRRISMRQSDLTPVAMIEKWNSGPRLIQRLYQGNRVHVIRRSLPHPIDETLEVAPGIHDPESFAFLLKGYPFSEQDTIAPINVLVADPNLVFTRPRAFAVLIVPRGEERITVPAGTFDCYVLEMTLAGILGYLVPNNRFWLLKADPHLIVKAEGGGEKVELVDGPFPCDGKIHCAAGAEVPNFRP